MPGRKGLLETSRPDRTLFDSISKPQDSKKVLALWLQEHSFPHLDYFAQRGSGSFTVFANLSHHQSDDRSEKYDEKSAPFASYKGETILSLFKGRELQRVVFFSQV